MYVCSLSDDFSPFLSLVQTQTGLCVADILQERVILTRKEGESSKCLNELLLSRMSRFRASHSATLAALTGSAITNTVKEEQSGNSTAELQNQHQSMLDIMFTEYFPVTISDYLFYSCQHQLWAPSQDPEKDPYVCVWNLPSDAGLTPGCIWELSHSLPIWRNQQPVLSEK